MDQRFDRRSKEQFKKDIKDSTREQSVILRSWLFSINSAALVFDYGSDNSGEYISDAHQVNSDPDYCIEGHGLVEVQYSNTWCKKYFHIKRGKILTCVSQDAKILMVNGWQQDNPVWTVITPGQCRVIAARFNIVSWYGGGSKDSHKVPIDWFQWKKFKKILK